MIGSQLPRWWVLVLLGVVALPILAALAAWKLISGIAGLRACSAAEFACPDGHTNPAVGRFQCGSCGALVATRAFAACPICGERPDFIECGECGLAIPRPGRKPW